MDSDTRKTYSEDSVKKALAAIKFDAAGLVPATAASSAAAEIPDIAG